MRGFLRLRVRVDGEMLQLAGDIRLEKTKFHSIEAVIDRVVIKAGLHRRLDESVSTAVKLGLRKFTDIIQEEI